MYVVRKYQEWIPKEDSQQIHISMVSSHNLLTECSIEDARHQSMRK